MDGLDKPGYAGRLIRPSLAPSSAPSPGSSLASSLAPSALAPGAPASSEGGEPQFSAQQVEADRIIARAKAQAETLISRAEGAAQRLIDEAGITAKNAGEARLAADLLAFNRKLRRELDEIRPLLVRMVRDAVEAIVVAIPEDQRIEQMITRALRDLDTQKSVLLHAARSDHAKVMGVVQAMARAGETSISTVFINPDIAPGTCRLEAGGLSVELGLGTQLELLESILLLESGGDAGLSEPLSEPVASGSASAARGGVLGEAVYAPVSHVSASPLFPS